MSVMQKKNEEKIFMTSEMKCYHSSKQTYNELTELQQL